MEIEYKRQHNESYMIIQVDEAEESFEYKMIKENEINALLDFKEMEVDGVRQYNYCISRKENLEDYFDVHDLTPDIFRRLVLNIKLAYGELDRYLIDERHIYLSKETIFLEKAKDSMKLSLCYYPKDMGSMQMQFRELMEYILGIVPAKDRDFTAKIYEAYDLCLKEDYTIDEILELLQEDIEDDIEVHQIFLEEDDGSIEEAEGAFVEGGDSLEDLYLKDDKKPGIFETFTEKLKVFVRREKKVKDVKEGETSYGGEDFIIDPDYELEEKTQLLTDTKPCGRLVYDGLNHEDDFMVNKDVFRIGSAKNNDAVIKAKTVSSNHAKIVKEGDDYFISDLNSLNSTFVNNRELTYRTPIKLNVMDRIRFASECYTFF